MNPGKSHENNSDRPNLMLFEPLGDGGVVHGMLGLMAALCQRERDGQGQVVTTSLYPDTREIWAEPPFSGAEIDSLFEQRLVP